MKSANHHPAGRMLRRRHPYVMLHEASRAGRRPALPHDRDRLQQQTVALLFTGHTLDHAEQGAPRFPPSMELVAKSCIRDAVRRELRRGRVRRAIAGGASGGDILFHEICAEFDIPSELFLAMPVKQVIENSVAPAGPRWVDRFLNIVQRCPVTMLPDGQDRAPEEGTGDERLLWRRCNEWMLQAAAGSADETALIALWDGESGKAPGGTGDMVELARERGTRTVLLDSAKLFGTP